MGGLSGLSGWSGLSGLTGLGSDWFVDSVNGNDANQGNTAAGAFQTIAALNAAITANDRIALAGGSSWREELTLAAGCYVGTYGPGAAPLLDASDAIANASFAKTGGLVNVYEISLTIEAHANNYVLAWEDDTRLTRVANSAACDASAGSYAVTSDAASPFTLYVHASDSSDVRTNGMVYEYSARRFGINGEDLDGITLNGVSARRGASNSGAVKLGRSARVLDCSVEGCGAHGLFVKDDAYLEGTTVSNVWKAGGSSHFIYNEDSPASLGITFVNCTTQNDAIMGSTEGFYGHQNVGGDFGAITLTDCTATNLDIGYEFRDTSGVTMTRCLMDSCDVGLRVNSTSDHVLTDCDYDYPTSGTRVVSFLVNATVTLVRLGVTSDLGVGAAAVYTAVACNVVATDCTFVNAGTNTPSVYNLANAGATLNTTGNAYSGWLRVMDVSFASGAGNHISDNNCYAIENTRHRFSDIQYLNITTYKAGQTQDQHSTVGGCDFSGAP